MNQIKALFWISLVVKLILAKFLPMTNDEAYYWVWSQNMQLSFYDHPPMVAWLMWLGHKVAMLGGGVRWPGVLLAHAALAIWLRILAPYLTERQLKAWLWLAILSPLVGGSAILVTPDLPLMFFFALALWVFIRWQSSPNWLWSLLLGLAMGLGFTAKYMMVLFALALLPVVLTQAKSRATFVRMLPLILIGGIVGTAPVWLWNFTTRMRERLWLGSP